VSIVRHQCSIFKDEYLLPLQMLPTHLTRLVKTETKFLKTGK
jgi:hypothetical protein